MSATVRITVIDNDGDQPELVYIVDNGDTYEEAVEIADYMASAQYANTGVIPRLPDGRPFYGDSDENEVNQ